MRITDLEIKLVKLIQKNPDMSVLDKVRDVVNSVPDFNIREKARTYLAVKKLVITGMNSEGEFKPANMILKRFIIGMNKINEHSKKRIRTERLKTQLREGRANREVFFLSSTHSNPACGHEPYQGKVYVDRFWKNTLKGNEALKKKVAAYIRNHNVMTVQELCREPVYFITRPYCKHFFVGVTINETLGSSQRSLVKKHKESRVTEHNIPYRKKFYKQRYRIHTVLGMTGEAEWDKKMIKRQE